MLTVHFHKVFNHLLEEYMVIARLVNQQVLDFNSFCDYYAMLDSSLKDLKKFIESLMMQAERTLA